MLYAIDVRIIAKDIMKASSRFGESMKELIKTINSCKELRKRVCVFWCQRDEAYGHIKALLGIVNPVFEQLFKVLKQIFRLYIGIKIKVKVALFCTLTVCSVGAGSVDATDIKVSPLKPPASYSFRLEL